MPLYYDICSFFFFFSQRRSIEQERKEYNLNNHYDKEANTKKSTNLLKASWAPHEQLLLKDCLDLWG